MGSFVSAKKRRIIFKSFIESEFKYCSLTWMFCSRKGNNKINRLHKRSFRIVNNDYKSRYEELLSHNNCFSIHDQNIHQLAAEIYKNFKNLLILKINIPFIPLQLKVSVRYFGVVIWHAVPINMKTANYTKNRIKFWKPECPCRLCKSFLQGLGFINIKEQRILSVSTFSFGF